MFTIILTTTTDSRDFWTCDSGHRKDFSKRVMSKGQGLCTCVAALVYKEWPRPKRWSLLTHDLQYASTESTVVSGVQGSHSELTTGCTRVFSAIYPVMSVICPSKLFAITELTTPTMTSWLVRREQVLSVLLWLKTNNPYYKLQGITIDHHALQLLPENGIPPEVFTVDEKEEELHI